MKPITPQKKLLIMGMSFSLLLLACLSFFFAFLSLNTDFALHHFANSAGTLLGVILVFIFSLTACICFVVAIVLFARIFHNPLQ
jgi:hypothetical protein